MGYIDSQMVMKHVEFCAPGWLSSGQVISYAEMERSLARGLSIYSFLTIWGTETCSAPSNQLCTGIRTKDGGLRGRSVRG